MSLKSDMKHQDPSPTDKVQTQSSTSEITLENIDTFRSRHETKLQWDFRRKFLLHYGREYHMDQLECWSKILSNVKFYGCGYDPGVLERLSIMLENMGEPPVQPLCQQTGSS